MKKLFLFALLIIGLGISSPHYIQAQGVDHLLISEFVVTPTGGEFIEIYNPTAAAIDLTNYYLTDGIYSGDPNPDYVNIVDSTDTAYSSDFLARFPARSSIDPGQYKVVALNSDFTAQYGFDPDFEMSSNGVDDGDAIPDMLNGSSGIGSNPGLSNDGEVIILFFWDGISDLVQDVDIALWGDKAEAVDKTGTKKDSKTDADSDSTEYMADTPIDNQAVIAAGPHTYGMSWQRVDPTMEGTETATGGNGIGGHDETSEDLATAFVEASPSPGEGMKINVTFIANTATVPDTLGPNSVVQIRGAGGPLTWGGDSPVFMQNVGGDYWTTTLEFNPGDAIEFKFFTNAHDTVYAGGEWEHQGWEGDVSGGIGTNRGLTVGNSDTTLPVQFVNGWKTGADQYEPPYTTNDSTFVVWIRVNCQGWQDFNPNAQQIGIRGGPTGEISWDKTYLLSQESDHVNGGSQQYSGRFFFSGPVHVPNENANTALEFKVVVHNAGAPLDEGWDKMVYNPSLQNHLDLSGIDTTNYWFWFDNMRPIVVEHKDTVMVEWVADMKNAIDGKGFAFGDTLEVRSGYYGTASEVRSKMMRRQGFSTLYSAKDTIVTSVGEYLDYQYYKIKNGVEYREIYYNFLYTGETSGEAERRVVDPIASSDIKVEDILDSQSEIHRMPLFRNTAILAQDVLVTFTCDVRPAIYQVMVGDTLDDIQGDIDITDPAQILQLGVAINGPATGSWGNPVGPDWGSHLMSLENKAMYDDGTHGDAVAGDSIFTIQFQYSKDSLDVIGQEFKFGIGGGDNEGGYGNNHIENIDDTNPTFAINAQFGSIDPVFYYTWDYDLRKPTDVKQIDLSIVPDEFSLEQNYPNPFNPTTEIIYTLPKETEVTVTIYNTIGQKIATLVSEKQAAGKYRVRWSGLDQNGMNLPTGIYFYRLDADEFTATKKMLLVK